MRIVRERPQDPFYIGSSNAFDDVRINEQKQARCASCDELWAWSMLAEKDGLWFCPNDWDSMNLREAMEQLADDAADAANYPVRYLTFQTPIDATLQFPQGAITGITTAAGIVISQTAPVQLNRGGAAVTVKLIGIQMSASDTLSYSTGITDNVAPVITATLTTLSLVASGGMTPGDLYSLTFNGTTFRNIFRVR